MRYAVVGKEDFVAWLARFYTKDQIKTIGDDFRKLEEGEELDNKKVYK